MKKLVFLFCLALIFSNSITAQSGYSHQEIIKVCDPDNIHVFGTNKPKPREGIQKIEHELNRDLKFLVNNPKFHGTVFIECTVNCSGETANYNVIMSSENTGLDRELVKLLTEITDWNIGTMNGQPADYWYLWKFRIKNGEIKILNKKEYYKK